MSSRKTAIKFKHVKSTLLNPVSDDQQMHLNDLVDEACRSRMDLEPTDPRAISYWRPVLWLWK